MGKKGKKIIKNKRRKQPKCALIDEWIKNMNEYNRLLLSHIKIMKQCHLQLQEWT